MQWLDESARAAVCLGAAVCVRVCASAYACLCAAGSFALCQGVHELEPFSWL